MTSSSYHFHFDQECIDALKSNQREYYRVIGNTPPELYDFSTDEKNIENNNNNVIIYRNAYLTEMGSLYVCGEDEDKCIITGYGKQFVHPVLPKDGAAVEHYDSIVTFSGLMSTGFWHFPMESIVSLRPLIEKMTDSEMSRCYIYVDSIDTSVKIWSELFKEEFSKFKGIITAKGNSMPTFATRVLAPERGKCGNPTFNQVKWLRDRVNAKLGFEPNDSTSSPPQDTVILIKRNYLRVLKNFDDVKVLVGGFAKKNGLNLYIHDDSKLPSLTEQLKMFRRAKFVVGSHGAGGVNLITCQGSGATTFIEFLNQDDINICYARLAKILDVKYCAIPVYSDGAVNLYKLVDCLK